MTPRILMKRTRKKTSRTLSQMSRILSLFVLMTAASIWFFPSSQAAMNEVGNIAERRPNFIVILADDMGWGDLSSYGATLIDTPNIDRIGEEGVKLTSFYAGANVCTPSRAALLTGRYAVRSGMQFVLFPHSEIGMAPEEITIAEMLKSAGYATGMIGKWHLGHRLNFWPTSQGFDKFIGVAYSNDMKPFDLYDGVELIESSIDQTHLTEKYGDAAVDFIDAHAEQPFFLYYAESFPHRPLYYPLKNKGRSEAGDYGDTVETIDDAVGRILDALTRNGIDDDTLIIFTSDNGPWFQGSAGPYRERKGGTYQGGYIVPFLARWPGKIPAGAESDEMAMAIDLLPTFAALAGAKAPQDRPIDGHDISPVLTKGAKSPHDYLYFFDGNDVAAVRDRNYSLVLKQYYRTYDMPFSRFGGPKLFDLKKDRAESYDVSSRHRKDYERLMQAYEQMSEEAGPLSVEPEPYLPERKNKPVGPLLNGE